MNTCKYDLHQFDTSRYKSIFIANAELIPKTMFDEVKSNLPKGINSFVIRREDFSYLFFKYSEVFLETYFTLEDQDERESNLGNIIVFTNNPNFRDLVSSNPEFEKERKKIISREFGSNYVTVRTSENISESTEKYGMRSYDLFVGKYRLNESFTNVMSEPDSIEPFVASNVSDAKITLNEYNDHLYMWKDFLKLTYLTYKINMETPLIPFLSLVHQELPYDAEYDQIINMDRGSGAEYAGFDDSGEEDIE